MRLLIHDLSPEEFRRAFPDLPPDVDAVQDDGSIRPCAGCFQCWLKTPGVCAIRDGYGDMGTMVARCDEMILVSRCLYGGFSPFVKNVMDRNLSYVHPQFRVFQGELHHKRRYNRTLPVRVWFHNGNEITDEERACAESTVHAMLRNLDGELLALRFANGPDDLGEVFA